MSAPLFNELAALTQARYQAEQAALQEVVSEEQKIRSEIAALEARHAQAQDAQRGNVGGLRHVGGDVLWQAWVSRARHGLQIQLAQILVRKSQKLQRLNLAHGRMLASQEIRDKQNMITRKRSDKAQFEQEQRLFLLSQVAKPWAERQTS